MKTLISIFMIAYVSLLSAMVAVSAEQSPITKEAQISIAFFEPEEKRTKDLKYAWAMASSINNQCMVIVWIRDKEKDTRIVWKSDRDADASLCGVYINRNEFERYFDYCVLSEIDVKRGAAGYHAAFGGGPAGGRAQYWFEWRDPSLVSPSFCCTRK